MDTELESIVISKTAVAVIRREMSKVLLTETGGPLVGYIDGQKLVVTDASGPGPRSALRPCSVLIDGVHAQRFCDAALKASSGIIDYVGDWHCHLGWSLEPSDRDLEAMAMMAQWKYSPTRTPVSLIWSRWTSRCAAYVFEASQKLRPVRTQNGE